MLVPVLGVVQVGVQPHADRYTYLPQIGIYVALTWLAGEWALRWKRSEAALGLLMAGIVGVLAICAFQQAGYWEDGEILWRQALANATEGSAGDVALIHYNLGLALRQDGNWEDAIEQYEKALETKPDYVEAQINLGSALLQVGKLDESISHLEKALRINPGYGQAENDLGNAYLQKGDAAEAIDHYQKAAKLEPDDPWVMNNLAWIYAAAREARFRNGAKAVELATQASRILGRNAVVLHTLAAALAEAGRFPEAVTTAQEALGLAQEQSNDRLAGQLQTELNLYQTGNPFHLTDQK
jgi:tetratricopeptide (TPR) repeat protein